MNNQSKKPDSHSKNALRCALQLLKSAKRFEQMITGQLQYHHDSSLSRFDVLANLELTPNHVVSTKELAELLIASKGNITRLLDRMEADGLIQRMPNNNDRRISDIYLTERGLSSFKEMAVSHEKWVDGIFNVLSNKETKDLISLLSKIRSRTEAQMKGKDV